MPDTLFGSDDDFKTNKQVRAESQAKSRVVIKSEWVAAIYNAYPRKVAPDYAMKCIKNKIKDLANARYGKDAKQAFEFLLDRTRSFANSQLGRTDREMIPHPSTWFNQGRFNDDPQEWNQWRGPDWHEKQKRADQNKTSADENKRRWHQHIAAMSAEDLAMLKRRVDERIRKYHSHDGVTIDYLNEHGVHLPGPFDRIAKAVESFQ